MEKTKEKLIELDFTATFDTKKDFERFVKTFGDMISREQKEALDVLIKEQMGEEPEELFCPKAGDILTLTVGDDDCPNDIFRYNGTSHTDSDGDMWLHAKESLSYSGDLMKPYLTVLCEDQDFFAKYCRHATEEERKLFLDKFNELKPEEGNNPWKVGDFVFVVCAESGMEEVFFPVPMSYADTHLMENRSKRGWIFSTAEECQAMCDKLNEAIKNAKP